MNYLIQYWLIRFFVFFFGLFPFAFSIWSAERVGDILFCLMAKRRRITLENIDKCFGDTKSKKDKERIARDSFRNMVISSAELFLTQKIKDRASESFTLIGNDYLEQAFLRGKGVTLVISHLGAWEYLSFLPFLTVGRDWTVVVKDIRNPYLHDYIKRLRILMTVVPIEKVNSMRVILRELKKNHGVAILIDQWAGSDGIWTDFFGVKTSTTSVPARLAKKTGCALVPAYCIRKGLGKYEIRMYPPVVLDSNVDHWEKRTTESLDRLLEQHIRECPEQWLWMHRRWKEKPSYMREP